MQKNKHDYYKEIDEALKSYENYRPYHTRRIEWIVDRIGWCWKFRHITRAQMENLADRTCAVLNIRRGI